MKLKKITQMRKWLIGVLLLAVAVAVSGCKTWNFYTQAFKGQYQIFAQEQSIEKLEVDPQTPGSLKARFKLLEDLRGYAKSELALPVDDHYRKYVDLHRPFVVWNVEAAPEFSMEPKTWWYPLVGSLKYRGYFSRGGATNYAGFLRHKGYDVTVGGVQAYSTLGWFKDPVLNTFLFEPDAELAEIIFHELGHQRVFARGDTDFNEAFATTVGQEGARRWLRAKGDQAALEQYEAHLRRTGQFVHLVMETRGKLEALYGDTRTEDGKVKATDRNHGVSAKDLRQRKRCIMEELQKKYAQLKAQWNGNTEFDWYFAKPANNAQLNAVANYYDLVPGFEQVLARHGGNLEQFYDAVQRLAKKPKKERHEWLKLMARINGENHKKVSPPQVAAAERETAEAKSELRNRQVN